MSLIGTLFGIVFAIGFAWAIAVVATNPGEVFWKLFDVVVDTVSAPFKVVSQFFSR